MQIGDSGGVTIPNDLLRDRDLVDEDGNVAEDVELPTEIRGNEVVFELPDGAD